MISYVIITPARDEEQYIAATIECVILQTVLPREWVIVNDGSSDRTGEILDRYAAQFPWIKVVHRRNRGFRKAGAGVIEAFYEGYRELSGDRWDFIVKLDGDLTFQPDYFERCFNSFREESRLGIGGGDIYHDIEGRQTLEQNPRFHVRGATKIYRQACWEAIGGLFEAPGWDTIDEVKANMLGWKTHSFPQLHLLHHRLTGTSDRLLRDRVKHGLACYASGYHFLFVLASCVRRLGQRPYITGSLAIFYGFLKGYVAQRPRVEDARLVHYVRGQQLRRLCGLNSIWK